MTATTLQTYLAAHRDGLGRGPIAVIFAEDTAEVGSSVAHAVKAGFGPMLVLGSVEVLPQASEQAVVPIIYDVHQKGAVVLAVNRVISAAPGAWIYWGFNAEYLFYPFAESRDVAEMLAFHTEERREAMLTCVVDLYAKDLTAAPSDVARGGAMFDRTGYYALRRFKGR